MLIERAKPGYPRRPPRRLLVHVLERPLEHPESQRPRLAIQSPRGNHTSTESEPRASPRNLRSVVCVSEFSWILEQSHTTTTY